jgi:hypothetical protein
VLERIADPPSNRIQEFLPWNFVGVESQQAGPAAKIRALASAVSGWIGKTEISERLLRNEVWGPVEFWDARVSWGEGGCVWV